MSGYEICINEIEEQGLKPSKRDEDMKLLLDTLMPTMALFQEKLGNLSCLFTYRQEEQQEKYKNNNGIMLWNTKIKATDTLGGEGVVTMYNGCKAVAIIGISVESLKAGREYATLIFLHELTHMIMFFEYGEEGSGHSVQFHNYLNMLLEIYNSKTGEDVKNDYYGINPPSTQ